MKKDFFCSAILPKLFAVMVTVELFTACTKTKDSSESYLKFNLNGSRIECSYVQPIDSSSPTALLYISGDWGTLTGSIYIIINTIGSGNIATGEYIFQPGNNHACLLYVNSIDYEVGYVGLTTNFIGSGKVIILEINNEYVKGTFELIAQPVSVPGSAQNISNGEFYVKRRP